MKTNFRNLLEQYITGEISAEDEKKFFGLLEQEEYRVMLENILKEDWYQESYVEAENKQIGTLVEQYVLDKINTVKETAVVHRISFMRRWRMVAAAALIFAFAGIAWFVFSKKNDQPVIAKEKINIDISAGMNGAILTLDNGKKIVLDSVQNGTLATQGNATISKKGDELVYDAKLNTAQPLYNTITTPKGRQYPNLVLSDGSRIWLDAGSSIRFPVSFSGTERRVEITGQVWFDVVHNDKMPFKVMAIGTEIEDIGTQFNVNAYDDEASLKVTLVEGAVKIKSTVLKPGQQAQVTVSGKMAISKDVNIGEVMAWKNGFFAFHETDIKGIMRQFSRWYDVEIKYEGVDPNETFTGKIDRNLTLAQVLKILEQTRVHFRIEEGRRLVIQK